MSDPSELIRLYLDGELDSAQTREFRDWLEADRENQRLFLREAHLHRELRHFAIARRYQESGPALTGLAADRSLSAPWRLSAVWASRGDLSHAWWGASAALLMVGAVLWLVTGLREPELILIAEAKGAAVTRSDGSTPVSGHFRLRRGDMIRTTAPAAIRLPARSWIELADQTAIQVVGTGRKQRFDLSAGAILARIATGNHRNTFAIATPHVEAQVVGTEFRLAADAEQTVLEVYQGTVRLDRASSSETLDLTAGFQARVQPGQPLARETLPQGAGGIEWEYWTGIRGRQIRDLIDEPRFPEKPSGVAWLEQLETPSQWADDYGARMRGYLRPDRTGNYTFWIAADDEGELWLSPDADPAGKQLICRTEIYTFPQQWDRSPLQKSAPIRLTADRIYYFEALHKEGGGGDCLAVAWDGPGLPRQLIGKEHLSGIPRAP